jgi:hypothetical protein
MEKMLQNMNLVQVIQREVDDVSMMKQNIVHCANNHNNEKQTILCIK